MEQPQKNLLNDCAENAANQEPIESAFNPLEEALNAAADIAEQIRIAARATLAVKFIETKTITINNGENTEIKYHFNEQKFNRMWEFICKEEENTEQ